MEKDKCLPDCPCKASGSCYSNHGCRCDICKQANATRVKRRRLERDPQDAMKHGMESTYINWNCRCDACTEAHRVTWHAQEEQRKINKSEFSNA